MADANTNTAPDTQPKDATTEPTPQEAAQAAAEHHRACVAERDAAVTAHAGAVAALGKARADLERMHAEAADGNPATGAKFAAAHHAVDAAEYVEAGAAARLANASAALTAATEDAVTATIAGDSRLNGDGEAEVMQQVAALIEQAVEVVAKFHRERDAVIGSAVAAATDAGLPSCAGFSAVGPRRFPKPATVDGHTPRVQTVRGVPGRWAHNEPGLLVDGNHVAGPVGGDPRRAALLAIFDVIGVDLPALIETYLDHENWNAHIIRNATLREAFHVR